MLVDRHAARDRLLALGSASEEEPGREGVRDRGCGQSMPHDLRAAPHRLRHVHVQLDEGPQGSGSTASSRRPDSLMFMVSPRCHSLSPTHRYRTGQARMKHGARTGACLNIGRFSLAADQSVLKWWAIPPTCPQPALSGRGPTAPPCHGVARPAWLLERPCQPPSNAPWTRA